jgi:hypothetical protein
MSASVQVTGVKELHRAFKALHDGVAKSGGSSGAAIGRALVQRGITRASQFTAGIIRTLMNSRDWASVLKKRALFFYAAQKPGGKIQQISSIVGIKTGPRSDKELYREWFSGSSVRSDVKRLRAYKRRQKK